MRRLATLVLCLCTACDGEVERTAAPAATEGRDATRPAPSAAGGTLATPPPTADAPPVERGPGPVGTWAIDEDARKSLVAGAKRTLDAQLSDRLAALSPEQRARAADAADAAAAAKARALRALEGLALTLEIRSDGTASNRLGVVGKDRETACTWTEEGDLLVLSRVDPTRAPEADERAFRFRRDGDVLTWERAPAPGRASVPLTLRRR